MARRPLEGRHVSVLLCFLVEMMTAVETSTVPLFVPVVAACEMQQPNQLYHILLLLCWQQLPKEAVNSGEGERMVAWRKLVDVCELL